MEVKPTLPVTSKVAPLATVTPLELEMSPPARASVPPH